MADLLDTGETLSFAEFRLDPEDQRIWRGDKVLPITPKAFQVLCHLARRPQRLVAKQELLDAVWSDVHVGDAVLKGAILEIRRVLGDAARAPRIIATEHRRGYRFISPVTIGCSPSARACPPEGVRPTEHVVADDQVVVGRSAEKALLWNLLGEAERGDRRLALVAGGGGYGKTALVCSFLKALAAQRENVAIARGQCLASGGPPEAYLPILDALGRAAAGRHGAEVRSVLRAVAPAVLVHLPALLAERELERLLAITAATRPDNMLRQLAEAIEALSLRKPLVLFLDDLHWSDEATLDLVTALMRRRTPARLLLVAACRPDGSPAAVRLESVMHDLAIRARAREIALDGLDEDATAEWCGTRLGLAADDARKLGTLLHRRCDGHPLFMEAIAEDLARRAGETQPCHSVELDDDIVVPRSVHDFIGDDLRRLDPVARQILETASVSSTALTIPILAAAADMEPATVERVCLAMAGRRHFLRVTSDAILDPADTASRIGFRHDIYREAVLAQLPGGQRRTLHARLGDALERNLGDDAPRHAVVLAEHFREAEFWLSACHYYRHASERAQRRHRPVEAVAHAREGLRLLERAPDTVERLHLELALEVAIGAPAAAASSWAAPELEEAYERAERLLERIDTTDIFPVLWGTWAFNVLRSRLKTARRHAARLLWVARRDRTGDSLIEARLAAGLTRAWIGDFAAAQRHLEAAVADYDERRHRTHASRYGQDPRVLGLTHLSWVSWFRGRSEAAVETATEAVTHARRLDEPHTLAFALGYWGMLAVLRDEGLAARELAVEMAGLADRHEFAQWRAFARFILGWATVRLGEDIRHGHAEMAAALAAYRDTGAEWGEAFFLALLAGPLIEHAGWRETAGQALDAARATLEASDERFFEAEVLRLRARYAAASGDHSGAERLLRQAVEIARTQRADELRSRAEQDLAFLNPGGSPPEGKQARQQLIEDAASPGARSIRRMT